MSKNKKNWQKLASKELFKTSFFQMRSDELLMPNLKKMPNYYVFDFTDWVNIVPVTTNNELVLIRQYRHAVEDEMLEIPGGGIDWRLKETPEQAALRELAEETGYVASEVIPLGFQRPNPALQSNRLWSFLALGCEKKFEQKLDEFEDIEVVTVPLTEALDFVHQGQIQHSLVIASLHMALKHLNI
ncbi:MAG: NUDIX hydrolase [Oligoflexia bacterium]|nr:NUDIX hydrolase [Oligoflexia bacterium]